MDNSDNQSISSSGSTLSTGQQKVECPFCDKDFQFRSIVNHIHTKHRREWASSLRHKAMEEAEAGYPLKVSWLKPSDFEDEPAEVIEVFACLGSHKTFLSESRAIIHFKKNPSLLKKHNAEIGRLLKERKKADETTKKQRKETPYAVAKENNDLSLVRGLYRNVLYKQGLVRRLLPALEKISPVDIHRAQTGWGKKWDEMPYGEIVKLAKETDANLERAMGEKLKSVVVLEKIYNAFERILETRNQFDFLWLYYSSDTNPEGMLTGRTCYGFVHEEMPPSPF